MPSRTIVPSQGYKKWPSYFLVRPTGEVVPLIAVDELSLGTNIVNVPRNLELEATKGMLNLGLQRSSSGYYQISSATSQARHAEIQTRPRKPATRNSPPAPALESTTSSEDEEDDTETEDHLPTIFTTQAPVQTNHNTQARTQLPSSYNNPQTETPLCRHWCAHGICKWGQQCRYKHIMPMTLHGLQEVGLRDWPAWYRGLNPGYFVDCRDGTASGVRVSSLRGKERVVTGVRRDERERKVVGGPGESRSAVAKGEELGNQILRRLRSMDKEREKEKGRETILKSKIEHEKEKERQSTTAENNAAAVDRAATKSVLRWEDDGSEVEELQRLEVTKKKMETVVEGSRKLVDV